MMRGWIAAAVLAMLVCGCASEQETQQADFEKLRDALATKGKSPKRVVTTDDDGLSVRKVVVNELGIDVGDVLMRYSQGTVLGEQESMQLSRNGLRLIRVKAEDVPRMLDEMGGANFDVDEWRGQVLEWSPVFERRVQKGQVLALDGRVNRIASGQLRLMVRSWTLMREDGPFVNLQLRPEVLRIQASNDLRAALEQRPQTESDVLTTLASEFALESGSVYVLAPEHPGVMWNKNERSSDGKYERTTMQAKVSGGRIGPMVEVGPEAATPQTLGELMLMTDGREAQRGLILFVPHISSRMLEGFAMSSDRSQNSGR